MGAEVYQQLAVRLDSLPNGFPATPDGLELQILARLFSVEEAELALHLRLTSETPDQVAARTGGDAQALRLRLKAMGKKGVIEVHKTDGGLAFALMPFVVGFYEMQNTRLDVELAGLVERYFRQAFGSVLSVEPALHRVLPIGETIPVGIDVQPFETAAALVNRAHAWGVIDCICRKQKALVGEACEHPLDVCMVFSSVPGAFDHAKEIAVQTRDEALATLRRAADAGLVHTVGNHQNHEGYICNCCTCSCGILRGVAELGISNVVARSAFCAQVDSTSCIQCEDCIAYCQFNALVLVEGEIQVDRRRCVGCGQCVMHCTQEALSLVRRPEGEIKPVPATLRDWQIERAAARGKDLADVW
jgi:Pyruvate/2-oxoacid:ferredoxin oxidoreductase delta subunit